MKKIVQTLLLFFVVASVGFSQNNPIAQKAMTSGINFLKEKQYAKAYEQFSAASAALNVPADAPFVQKTLLRIAQGKLDSAQNEANRALSMSSSETKAANLLLRSKVFYLLSQWNNALDDVQEALQKGGNTEAAYLLRAQIYIEVERYKDALTDLNSLTPNSETNNLKAQVLLLQRDFSSAESFCSTLLKINPADWNALLNRASARLFQNKNSEALNDAQLAEKYMPTVQQFLAISLQATANNHLKKYAAAHTLAERALKLNASYVGAYAENGKAYLGLGDTVKAIAAFDKTLNLKPDYPEIQYLKGRALFNAKQFTVANAALSAAIKNYTPKMVLVHEPSIGKIIFNGFSYVGVADAAFLNGQAFQKLGLHDSAAEYFEQCVAFDSTHIESWKNLFDALDETHQYAHEEARITEALAANPNNTPLICESLHHLKNLGDTKTYELSKKLTAKLFEKRDTIDRYLYRAWIKETILSDFAGVIPDLDTFINNSNLNHPYRTVALSQHFVRNIANSNCKAATKDLISYLPFLKAKELSDVYGLSAQYCEEVDSILKHASLNGQQKDEYFWAMMTDRVNTYEEKMTYYKKAFEINPKFIDGYYRRVQWFEELGKLDLAIQDLETIITLKPTPSALKLIYIDLGREYSELKDYDKSLFYFQKASDLDPNYETSRKLLSQYSSGRCEEALESNSSKVSDQRVKVMAFIRATQFKDTIVLEKTKRLLKDSKTVYDSMGVYIALGAFNIRFQKFSEAISNFQNIIDVNSRVYNTYGYIGLGKVDLRLGEFDNALKHINLGLNAYQPYEVIGLGERGLAYLGLRNDAEALKDVNKSFSIDSTQGSFYKMRYFLHQKMYDSAWYYSKIDYKFNWRGFDSRNYNDSLIDIIGLPKIDFNTPNPCYVKSTDDTARFKIQIFSKSPIKIDSIRFSSDEAENTTSLVGRGFKTENKPTLKKISTDEYILEHKIPIHIDYRSVQFTVSVSNAQGTSENYQLVQRKKIEKPAPNERPKPQKIQKRIALVLGNGKYKKYPALNNPTHDATDMSDSLKKAGFTVIETGIDQSLGEMRASINTFLDAVKDFDVSLFYYAGHGKQFEGENYLMPIDAHIRTDKQDVKDMCVSVSKIVGGLKQSGDVLNLVFIDACRVNDGSSETTDAFTKINLPTNTYIFHSTLPDKLAYDGKGKNGTFTDVLLNHLLEPNLPLKQFFDKVVDEVYLSSNKIQTPQYFPNVSPNVGFYFRVE